MTAHSSPDIQELSAHSAQEDHPLSQAELDDPPPSPVPSYPHSQLPTPAYTSQPQTAEQTVTRGPLTPAELTGQITYEAKRFRITYGAQQHGRTTAQGPEYTRGSKLRGVVRVEEKWREKIVSVELKVLGTIKLSIADSGSTNTVFLTHTIRLYPSPTTSSPSSSCPEALHFKWPLPATYLDTWGGPHTHRNRPLPPTYELTITEVPGLRARVRYEVEAIAKWKWKGLVTRKESLNTPFTYIPYAPHPQHAHTSVLSTLKSCPGEWISHTERVPTRGPDVGEIISSLVLPTPPLHPLSQPIPFHFQLSAECPPHLQSNNNPNNIGRRRLSITSTSSKPRSPTLTRNPHPNPNSATTTSVPIALLAEPALLRLTIQRQVSVDVRGARALRVICGGVGRMERVVLGTGRRVSTDGGGTRYEGRGVQVVYEGQVADATTPTSPAAGPAPPAYTSLRRTNSIRSLLSHMSGGVGVHHTGGGAGAPAVPPGVERVRDWDGGRECFAIAWEGSVTPERDILQVGGFRAGGLLIKDFVTLTLVPPTPELSPLRALQQAVPVRCIVVSDADMQAAMHGSW